MTEVSDPKYNTQELNIFQSLTLKLMRLTDTKEVLRAFVDEVSQQIEIKNILTLTYDKDTVSLNYFDCIPPLKTENLASQLKNFYVSTFNAHEDPITSSLLEGKAFSASSQHMQASKFADLLYLFPSQSFYFMPIRDAEMRLVACFIITSMGTLKEIEKGIILTGALVAEIAYENAFRYSETVQSLENTLTEMNILQQIDTELKDTINLDIVFSMLLDWALRFTNANAAALSFYNGKKDTLRLMAQYGYPYESVIVDKLKKHHTGGITHRAARTGEIEIIPDTNLDKDYLAVMPAMRSQISLPIIREDRVIAVLSLESLKLNGFNDSHIEFVKKLAQRAGVAIDNARLFTETEYEREKVSYILSNIDDLVLVISFDNYVNLINPSAIAALRLATNQEFVGRKFTDVVEHRGLLDALQQVNEQGHGYIEELSLPNGRTYHTHISRHEEIGWLVVMQDITPFKETDKLKSELISTVSHDLKQPLSVMGGYLDLIQMIQPLEGKALGFLDKVYNAVNNMQQLIDDLLDLAKIESGFELDLKELDIHDVIEGCLEINRQIAINKQQTISIHLPDHLRKIRADPARMRQIFTNLIGNAIKYTPPNGKVEISADQNSGMMLIFIKDDGIGISPEDQAHVFDRFYRVRMPETDSIEGTGLGLAIVKTLVEAHKGQIDLESQLGKGSTFKVTLPVI
ncbi:hypothetical protein MASR2M15_18140 [Anaerolineales bacterium]